MDAKERQYTEARINDAVARCRLRNIPEFVGFIDAGAALYAAGAAKRAGVKFMLCGGYDDAERVYFGAFPDRCEPTADDFPIARLKIENKGTRLLTHRDILGAIMSLGLERDTVGDIAPDGKDAVVFVSEQVAGYITEQTDKIASCGVAVTRDRSVLPPVTHGFEEKSDTVASPRLDCIVASLSNTSRGKAVLLINSGAVSVGGIECDKLTKEITAGDVIVIRHVGKFVVDSVSDLTKKGRLVLKYRKYI